MPRPPPSTQARSCRSPGSSPERPPLSPGAQDVPVLRLVGLFRQHVPDQVHLVPPRADDDLDSPRLPSSIPNRVVPLVHAPANDLARCFLLVFYGIINDSDIIA